MHLGIMVWLPAVIVIRQQQPYIPYACLVLPSPTYAVIQATLVYYLPIIAMLYFCTRCLYGLHVQFTKVSDPAMPVDKPSTRVEVPVQNKTSPTTTTRVSSTQKPTSPTGHPCESRSMRTITKKKEHVKIIRTFGIIIVMFLLCWLPFCVFWPITVYCPLCIPLKWYEYSVWSAFLNSSVNPTLYFLCNRDFRLALKNLINKLNCKK